MLTEAEWDAMSPRQRSAFLRAPRQISVEGLNWAYAQVPLIEAARQRTDPRKFTELRDFLRKVRLLPWSDTSGHP